MAGLWLLVAEHLRLGTWDLLCGWTRQTSERIEPRLALQLVHEAALCTTGLREGRCLTLRGFVLPHALHHSRSGPYFELVQRHGERSEDWYFNAFLSTTDRDPVNALTRDYPQRWHIEEFFNFNEKG